MMKSYKLKILRNDDPVTSRDAAIEILNNYEDHHVGQPISIVYLKDNERNVLFAIGKRDSENEQIDGRNHGEEFYDIIGDYNQIDFVYKSNYPADSEIRSDVGEIKQGTTIYEIINSTGGDISNLIDALFFGLPSTPDSIKIYAGVVEDSKINIPQLTQQINQFISNGYLKSESIYNNIILHGIDNWARIIVCVPNNFSCKFNGDTERNNEFMKSGEVMIDNVKYNIYYSWLAKFENHVSYYYVIRNIYE